MANNNEFKNFTNVEFDGIKDSLKTFLQSQDTLKDYDFEGSTLNILLDVLAYNTQYNAFYLNMLASERFIATAQRRSSLVQIARTLGYNPHSVIPASAFVNLKITPDVGYTGPIILQKGFTFTTTVDNVTYKFITREEHVINQSGDGFYYIDDLQIYEGKQLRSTFTVSEDKSSFVIPNKGVDTRSIRIFVYDGPSDTSGFEWDMADDFTQVTGDDTKFFVEETDAEYHKIYFGDDVIGKQLAVGNIVEVQYYVSSGSDANGSRLFAVASTSNNVDTVEILSEVKASGGADIEPEDSIRLQAPLFFQRQNRAITASDYASIVKELYPAAQSVTAWGGENEEPPKYGYVYISVLPESGTVLSSQTKNILQIQLKQRYTNVSTTPVIVDPNYIYVRVKSLVRYDSRKTNPGAQSIKASAVQAIKDYGSNTLNQFSAALRYSKMLNNIDLIDESVVSNETEVELYVEYVFLERLIKDRQFDFKQAIEPNTIRSNTFTYNNGTGYFFDESDQYDGFLALYKTSANDGRTLVQDRALLIDYTTGLITINNGNFTPEIVEINSDEPLQLYAIPEDNDVRTSGNNILAFKDNDIFVEVEDVSTGVSTGTINFTL